MLSMTYVFVRRLKADYVLFFFFFKQKTAYEMQRGLVGSEMCIRDRIHNNAGKFLEIQSPAVVPHPLPCGEKICLFRCGKRSKIGKPFDELRIDHRYPRDLGMLEHNFGDNDFVRVPSVPPLHIVPALRFVKRHHMLLKIRNKRGRDTLVPKPGPKIGDEHRYCETMRLIRISAISELYSVIL
eukprot:TRINITY_DN5344_c0_g1_i2.p2 TRINITY_DN5344_c0_g1~~TRINITY_DN5344_c0_g1_i2.p2  ORF type:complete len:183 (-),score=23.39 TRINITY_DN5344_c0_g1_i2:280-828(-)